MEEKKREFKKYDQHVIDQKIEKEEEKRGLERERAQQEHRDGVERRIHEQRKRKVERIKHKYIV